MSIDFEKVTQNLKSSPAVAKLLENRELLNALQSSADGKKLMNILNRAGEDTLNKALQSALSGRSEDAKNLLSSLFSTAEGAEVIKNLSKIVKE